MQNKKGLQKQPELIDSGMENNLDNSDSIEELFGSHVLNAFSSPKALLELMSLPIFNNLLFDEKENISNKICDNYKIHGSISIIISGCEGIWRYAENKVFSFSIRLNGSSVCDIAYSAENNQWTLSFFDKNQVATVLRSLEYVPIFSDFCKLFGVTENTNIPDDRIITNKYLPGRFFVNGVSPQMSGISSSTNISVTKVVEYKTFELPRLIKTILNAKPHEILDFFMPLSDDEFNNFENYLKEETNERKDVIAILMYYLRYFEVSQSKKLISRAKIIEKIAINILDEHYKNSDLPYPLLGFDLSLGQMNILNNNIKFVQLSQGCGGRCAWCYVDAAYGVRHRMPYKSIMFLNKYISLSDKELYWGSDPLEICVNDHDYFSFIETIVKSSLINSRKLSLTTSIPQGTEERYKRLIAEYGKFIYIRVSISQQNIKRLIRAGILLPDSESFINCYHLNKFSDSLQSSKIFNPEYIPNTTGLRFSVSKIGANEFSVKGHFLQGFGGGYPYSTVILTPFSFMNIVPQMGQYLYPQRQIVIPISFIARVKPGSAVINTSVINLLRTNICTGYDYEKNIYRFQNQAGVFSVKVDNDLMITRIN